MTTRRAGSKPLPPPTASEAAFERALDVILSGAREASVVEEPRASRAATVDRLFERSTAFLERDPFAGIGERESFPTKIVGVSFEGRQDLIAGLEPGRDLELRRDPSNTADANAIEVRYGELHVGFLRRQIARHLAPLIDSGIAYRASLEHVTGGRDGKHFGANIRVERVAVLAASSTGSRMRATADGDALRRALIGGSLPHDAQQAVLERLERGKNTLAVMGTGRGKSFCFQYPAVLRALESGSKTLVVYPLRALANDQFVGLESRLESFGLRLFRANGAISAQERSALMEALREGAWDIVLSTPEFLQYHRDAFAGPSAPALVVVDEAHHVFESKHRAAYGRLGETIAQLGNPQVLALTATARDEAFAQIRNDLKIDSWVIDPTVRENLRVVDARGTKHKSAYLKDVLAAQSGKCIIYCNSRSEATKVAQSLRAALDNQVLFYHAGMPSADRREVETLFRSGALRAVVATSAFGEGIDLPDVRNVVLYHLNFDFTEFNQQAGRAGRDGNAAQIHLLFGEGDSRVNEFIIGQDSPTLHTLRAIYRGLRGMSRGGELRTTFADAARTLDFDKVNERTVAAAIRIFEDEGLIETGIDDDGRYARFVAVDGKIDLTRNERFVEGEAAREDFALFRDFILSADAATLERVINRPIYPQRVTLRK